MALPLRPAIARADLSIPPVVWPLVGLLCLPLAALAGKSAAHSLTLVVIGVGGMAVFALALLSPPAGIAGLILAAGSFARVHLGTGTGSPLVASLLVAFAITAAWIFG